MFDSLNIFIVVVVVVIIIKQNHRSFSLPVNLPGEVCIVHLALFLSG